MTESRIGQLDNISAMLNEKLKALDAAPAIEPVPQRTETTSDAMPHVLPTDSARELVETVEADLTSLAQEWTSWRERLAQWEATQSEQ